jgi:hypothetical protein
MFKTALLATTLTTTLFALPAFAEFEGEVEMKMTGRSASGTMKLSVSGAGMRNEMSIQTPQFPMNMTMLFKKSSPDVAYTINDRDKTYGEIDLKQGREMAAKSERKFTAKKLGTEKIKEWNCVHAIVTDDQGRETEIWTNKDLLDWKAFLSTMTQSSPANDGMMKALKDAGAEGFPVKLVTKTKRPEDAMTMEVVSVTKKSLPKSLFEIPSSYKKAEGGMGGAQLPPEIQKQLMEKMKNLTPEQQEQIRRAMEKQAH